MKAGLKAAYELCEGGGDWERKNRLKVGCLLVIINRGPAPHTTLERLASSATKGRASEPGRSELQHLTTGAALYHSCSAFTCKVH